ncbi:MAG: ATP phosphoribosyltransferase regulatory subunit [Saezia sp.]
MSAWLLPESIADVLPCEARRIEDLRRELLDTARSYGYELVMPPMLEHLASLVGDDRQALDLKTFKLVDQLSGRMLGVRADTTPQVARIDAHLLNRAGVVRMCYCGPVLHTIPADLHSTREQLQFGAELYGYAGTEADLEIQSLLLTCLARVGIRELTLNMADVRIVRALMADVLADPQTILAVYNALSYKDASELESLTRTFPKEARHALSALLDLYGDMSVLDEALRVLPQRKGITEAINDLRWLAQKTEQLSDAQISFDLADLRGYGYYTGTRFAVYSRGSSSALARGGRYDEVGAIYGRMRPAVGFSLDVKLLTSLAPDLGLKPAILAPWGEDVALLQAIQHLRAQGETVVVMLPGDKQHVDEFNCDRRLDQQQGKWVVVSY